MFCRAGSSINLPAIQNMNDKITLEKKTTHKYRSGYSYLDDGEEIGTARQIGSKLKSKDSEGERHLLLFLVNSQAPHEEIVSAFYDTLRTGCRCEHDCCGHYQTHVAAVKRIKGGKMYAVLQSSYRNI